MVECAQNETHKEGSMKVWLSLSVFSVLGLILTASPDRALAQGSLTPPGAPAPTMKTLSQVEPRTPITNLPMTISSRGSYYLTTNVTGTLTISSDDVTVDLMGFTIQSISGDAIDIPATQKNLVIRNGTISRGSVGIDGRYLRGSNSRFENLTISDCSFSGLYIGSDCLVENCLLISNGTYGVQSSSAGRLEVRNCRIIGTTGDGLYAYGGSRIIGNAIENSGDNGLRLTGSGSFVADNIVKGNVDNYDIADGNQLNLLLCEIPETLDWPCSVKLVGTLTCSVDYSDGIGVNSDNVTIDLDGHALIGTDIYSDNGIYQASSYQNLTVSNGKLVNWRGNSNRGIYAAGSGNLLYNLQATSNYNGLSTGPAGIIRDCMASHSTDWGIALGNGGKASGLAAYNNGYKGILTTDNCIISDSTAYGNSGNGIEGDDNCLFDQCIAYSNGGAGITVSDECIVSGCIAYSNGGDGIHMSNNGIIQGCSSSWNTENGINVYNGCLVRNSTANINGSGGDGAGIWVRNTRNRIEGNTVASNDRGIDVDFLGNFITRNSASANTTNWTLVSGNHCLVIHAHDAGAISGDSGGVSPGSSDPNANFTY